MYFTFISHSCGKNKRSLQLRSTKSCDNARYKLVIWPSKAHKITLRITCINRSQVYDCYWKATDWIWPFRSVRLCISLFTQTWWFWLFPLSAFFSDSKNTVVLCIFLLSFSWSVVSNTRLLHSFNTQTIRSDTLQTRNLGLRPSPFEGKGNLTVKIDDTGFSATSWAWLLQSFYSQIVLRSTDFLMVWNRKLFILSISHLKKTQRASTHLCRIENLLEDRIILD